MEGSRRILLAFEPKGQGEAPTYALPAHSKLYVRYCRDGQTGAFQRTVAIGRPDGSQTAVLALKAAMGQPVAVKFKLDSVAHDPATQKWVITVPCEKTQDADTAGLGLKFPVAAKAR
jgi:hypothetical protein